VPAIPLEGKSAIVTGASSGFGKAIADALRAEGVKVAVGARRAERLEGDFAHELDVTDPASAERFVAAAVEALGGLDIVVNNAATVKLAEVEKLATADWQAMLSANLTGPFMLCRAAIPHLKRRGGGSIVNVSSLAGQNPFAGGACYAATKAGLDAFSHALMQELRQHDIRVSVVAPGSVATGFGGHAPTAADAWKLSPEDVAETIFHLVTHPARSLPSRVDLRPSRPQKA
jgi:NADP-dependent 3-hydroxy acid dehydrogenase YdfG